MVGCGSSESHSVSLPLMGIGNVSEVGKSDAEDSVTCPHYPSWGLETRRSNRRAQRVTRTSVTSLPLMGIGNPHHASRSSSGPRHFVSLPLMGIGNPQSTNRLECLGTPSSHYPSWGLETQCLITPHGDWKPGLELRIPAPSLFSLPLMGIGNVGLGNNFATTEKDSLPLMGIGNL